jgi:hypothetical protein
MRIQAVAVAVLVVGACGDDLHGLTLHELEASRRAAECERYVHCGVFDTVESCTAVFRATFDPALPAAIDAGKIRFDPVAASACNDALAARSCDVTAADARRLPDVCDRVLIGTIAAGATCLDDRECGTQRCDAARCEQNACCPGGCAAFVAPAKLDAACEPEVGCVDGAFCGADKVCHTLVAMAGDCHADAECALGLACIGPTELQAGACRPLPKLGEQCPYQRCAEIGARCDGQTCVRIGRAGDPCANGTECSEFFICDSSTQRCREQPHLGETCFGRCAGEAWCELTGATGTCRSPQPNAAPCTADNQCATQFCEEGAIFDQCAQPALCF